MRALACPASLKGVLSAGEAAAALAAGFREAGVDADECPIADGGEGTAEVLFAALGGEWREAAVSDPLGRPVRALAGSRFRTGPRWWSRREALGLGVLPRKRDPLRASSRGLGELIAPSLAEQPRALLVGLGGSATDGRRRGHARGASGAAGAYGGAVRRALAARRRGSSVRAPEGRVAARPWPSWSDGLRQCKT